MIIEQIDALMLETIDLQSQSLNRNVQVDFYHPPVTRLSAEINLLLVNDGQDLASMNFGEMFKNLQLTNPLKPLVIAAIHCGPDRKKEYGMSSGPDYLGRGSGAALYEEFIVSELIPFIRSRLHDYQLMETGFAGFSLGGLSAMDIAWNNPGLFTKAGVFSGSFWWRSLDSKDKNYNQHLHRMMHVQVRAGHYQQGMRFFFQCGELDETADRNHNGVIDSIDDTIDLMRELYRKGYREKRDMYYLQIPDGRHDIPTWKKAIPTFLKWGWSDHTVRS